MFRRAALAGALKLPHRLADWTLWIGDAETYLAELERFAVQAEAGQIEAEAREFAPLVG